MDLLVSVIGLALITYFVILLGGTRLAIKKGFNAVIMFSCALLFPPIALIIMLFIYGRENVERDKKVLSVISFGK